MSCVPMAPFHGHHSMSCGENKPQSFFQLSSWSMAVVKGTLMEYEFLPLPKDGHALFHCGVVSQEMFEILYFMGGNPLHDNFEFGVFLLHSYPVGYMQVYMCMSGPCLNCSFFHLPLTDVSLFSLSHHWAWASALLAVPMVTLSRIDFTASVFSFDVTQLRTSTMALSLHF